MKEVWRRWTSRFAALTQRERAVLISGCLAAILLLGHLLILQPLFAQRARLTQQITQQRTDLHALTEQIQALNQSRSDPDAASRAQLAGLRQQLRALDDQFKQLQQVLVSPQEMADVLEDLLKRNRGLQLKALHTLPMLSVDDIVSGKAEKADKTAAAPAKEMHEAWLYRHGVEITLQGSYADILVYLGELEHLPRRVYWGELKLSAETYPVAVMTVTVYTLSLEKTWLVV